MEGVNGEWYVSPLPVELRYWIRNHKPPTHRTIGAMVASHFIELQTMRSFRQLSDLVLELGKALLTLADSQHNGDELDRSSSRDCRCYDRSGSGRVG